MSIGLKLNNPFDLETDPKFTWQGEIKPSTDPHGIFCQFDTMFDGLRAGFKDLHNQYVLHGINNLKDLITKFAPPAQNDTAAYIAHACEYLNITAAQVIDLSDPTFLAKLGKFIILQEQGIIPFPDRLIAQAVDAALGITQIGA